MGLKQNKKVIFPSIRADEKLFNEVNKEIPKGKRSEFRRQCIKDGLSKLKATKEKKLKSIGVLE